MPSFQEEVERRGHRIFELVNQHPQPLFSRAGLYQRVMELSMRDEDFKVQMFRFVDVLPSLRRSSDIVQHLDEYFTAMRNGSLLRTGVRMAKVAPWISAFVLRRNVSGMARQFIAGKNPHEVTRTLRRRYEHKIGFTVDLLGEAVVSEKEADVYAARCLELLENLARETRTWRDPLGDGAELFPVVNLSVKVSALSPEVTPRDIAQLSSKLRPILHRAKELGGFVNFDMESFAVKNLTLKLFKTLFTEPEFRDWPHAGIVIQAYLRESEKDLRDLIEWGRARGTPFGVRLVKGAYWDYETLRSARNGWPVPVFQQKPESDANFEKLSRILLENQSIVTPAFGSHNVRSIAAAQVIAHELEVPPSRFEFQLLYGMAAPIKRALVAMGYRVREYCPVGELLSGMSYLVRRLLENTSNEGFLRAKFAENVSEEELLRDPTEVLRQSRNGAPHSTVTTTMTTATAVQDRQLTRASSPETPLSDNYENAPLTNFAYPENLEKMRTALRDARARFGKDYPLVINGEKVFTGKTIPSLNPSAPDQVVGNVAEAGIDEAERAVKAARQAFEKWRWTPFEERCQLLERAAEIMERRRFELSALEVYEVGKPWTEADGDIREAIDFCSYYAHEMRRIGRSRLTQRVPGEESYYHYWP
ncbi:MAG: proline dehydrogenase family protein, partial [Chthoniobacterales bacterium]